MRYRALTARALALLTSALWAGPAAANEVFDARGFNRDRDYFNQLPYEHIDPLTGNLILTFTDLVLPGNAGFDLVIRRTYNSKIYRSNQPGTLDEDSWAGVGWTLHLGRIRNPTAGVPGPVEMADGSSHKLYNRLGGQGGFISRDHWLYDKNTARLSLTNGLVYTFGRPVTLGSGQQFLYVTRIEDPFGNRVDVTYMTGAGLPPDGIASIVQDLGGQQRTVTFTAGGPRQSLQSMSYINQNRTWTYTTANTNSAGFSLLTQVQPPEGPPWVYGYDTTAPVENELTQMTTPRGGIVFYAYSEVEFRIGNPFPTRSRAVTGRSTAGRDVSPGSWSYAYAQGSGRDQTVITSPCVTTTHTFLGVGNFGTQGAVWRIGLPSRIVTSTGGTVLQEETRNWAPSVAISGDEEIVGLNRDTDIFVPLLASRRITRGERNYDTSYAYNTANFNDYARAATIGETGELTRTTSRTFRYGFTPYIVDRLGSETVNAGGTAFTKSYDYSNASGFMTAESIFGISRSFGLGSRGNVGSVTDGNGNTTAYAYSWGIVSQIATPQFTINRTINPDGTVASETRRGFTTSYAYDALSRPTAVQPPVGNAIGTTYTGSFVEVVRGPSRTRTNLDGFGRESDTDNNAGVRSNKDYDACGRLVFESYPFFGSASAAPHVAYQYDGLGRVTRKTHPDGKRIAYAFSAGVDVTVTDEENRVTFLDHSAFGDPAETRLTALRDAANQVTSYSYNALGSLTEVGAPGGVSRSFSYNARNELQAETHPESGTVTYTYEANGNLDTRTDPAFGQSVYTYDGNNRLLFLNRPGGEHDVGIAYDASDNRTQLSQGGIVNTYAYDEANRMLGRTYAVNGQSFGSAYAYDGNDNLTTLSYPTGLQVRTTYDAENRITSVARVSPATNLATNFIYHASGAPLQFTAGNGIVHALAYDGRYRQRLYSASGVLAVTYSYDGAGNVTGIDDARAGFDQGFGYDALDRLTGVSGLGAGSFAYDAVGNRTRKVVGSATTNYGYTSQRLTSATGAEPDNAFQYDANGNMTRNQAGQYAYSPANMMLSATVGGAVTNYRYDGDDLRRWAFDAVKHRYFIHGLGNQLLSELRQCPNGPVQSVTDYVYAGARLIAELGAPTVAVQLDVAELPVLEGQPTGAGSVARLAVSVSTEDGSPLPAPVTVAFATVAGSATAGADFAPASGTLSFSATGTQFVDIPLVNDTQVEDDEQFSFVLSNASCGATLGRASAVVTILDDDPVVGFTAAASEVEESGSSVAPVVVLSTRRGVATTHAVTVDYATGGGTATPGVDYTPRTGTLTFPRGWTSGNSQSITLLVFNDRAVEPDETFGLTLANATPGTGTGHTSHTVTILDDDPVVSFVLPGQTVDEGIGQVTPVVRLTTRRGVPITHAVAVTPRAVPGSAREGQDYLPPTGTLNFPHGSASGSERTVPVAILDDPNDEPDQNFRLELSTADGEVGPPHPVHVVTIQDNDPEPTMKIVDVTVVEGDGSLVTAVFDVHLDVTSEFLVTADYATSDFSAQVGHDYWPRAGTVVFPPETPTRRIKVPVIGDWVHEDPETFRVTLSNPTHARLEDDPQADGLVQDTDAPGFTIEDVRVSEGAAATLTVTLVPKPLETVSIYYETVAGTATADVDYVTASGELVFEAEQPTAKLSVKTIVDSETEGVETFRVRLFALSSPPIARAEAVVTIVPHELGTDFNSDRRTDFLWHHGPSGQASAWYMDGPLFLEGSALNPNGVSDTAWKIAGTGDFNDDAKADLVWRRQGTGDIVVWFMDGVTMTSGTPTTPPSLEVGWKLAATADFDRDGGTDFLWHHQGSGQLVVWFMNGAVLREGLPTVPPLLADLSWQVAGLADFTLDGKPDILWRHQTSGQLVFWAMDGVTQTAGDFLDPEQISDLNWKVMATRDMDHDGRPDIVWRHAVSGQISLWHMDGTVLMYGELLNPPVLPDLGWTIAGPR
jgi:YD repeat-containing protein